MKLFESILDLTDKVEALIADGRWSEAAALETERRDLLVRYVAEHGGSAAGLRELYERSIKSMSDVTRQRALMSGDASRLIGNSRAVDAYLENAGAAAARGGA